MQYDYSKIFCSLTGFYQTKYDELSPYEIAHLYIQRKEQLYAKKGVKEAEYLLFAKEHTNTIIGFYKDKQNKRYV